jgi:hypothetical protein
VLVLGPGVRFSKEPLDFSSLIGADPDRTSGA